MESNSGFALRTPPVDQLVSLLNSVGVETVPVTGSDRAVALAAVPGAHIRVGGGSIVWNDGFLDIDAVAAIALWLVAYFDGHELWMADGSGSVLFRIDATTLRSQLERKSAGLSVIDPDHLIL